MLAVLVLHAGEDRELVTRAEVHLELARPVDDVIVDAFGVATVAVAARLPAAFENVARVPRVGGELRSGGTGGEHERRDEQTREQPASAGEPLAHGAPYE